MKLSEHQVKELHEINGIAERMNLKDDPLDREQVITLNQKVSTLLDSIVSQKKFFKRIL